MALLPPAGFPQAVAPTSPSDPARRGRRGPRHAAPKRSRGPEPARSEARREAWGDGGRARRSRPPRRGVMATVGRTLATVATLVVSALLLTAAGFLFFMHLSVQPVLTGSMQPTFGPGWAIVSRSIPVTAIRPGMVVIFVPPDHAASYAHRVVTVTGSPGHPVLTTKGDANPGPDPWHARIKSTTIQEVVWSVPWFGRAMVAVHGQVMTVFLVLVAGLFVAITGMKSILRPRSPRPAQYPRPLAHPGPIP